jgi:perosamine synthetase
VIKLAHPDLTSEDLDAVRNVLASGQLVQGAVVAAFERAVADYVGVEHAVAVNSGTSALYLALRALGIGPGNRVAVTAYSWPATGNVIELVGATPVFVDIEPRTFNMDPACLEDAFHLATARPPGERIKAVLPVDAFGLSANLTAIAAICAREGVPMVEDAACALGATHDRRKAGSWPAMGCFSFHPRKALTTAEGGMITTADKHLARELRILRNHGLDPEAVTPTFVAPGFNMRLTEPQAAMGLSQLKRVETMLALRRELAQRYGDLLTGSPIQPPCVPDGYGHAYQSYVVLLPEHQAQRPTDIISTLRQEGIETTIGTYLMPATAYFRSHGHFSPERFPVGTSVADRALSLPLHAGLTPELQRIVVDRLFLATT